MPPRFACATLAVQETVTTVGEALLGGPFELVDADGVPVTDAAFKYVGAALCDRLRPRLCNSALLLALAAHAWHMHFCRGKHTLIYFGFTFCPDICPNELVKMGRVLDKLAENKDLPEVVPIFITVDPYRDSVDQLKEYMKGACARAAWLAHPLRASAAATLPRAGSRRQPTLHCLPC